MTVGDIVSRALKGSSRKKQLFPEDEVWCDYCAMYVRRGKYCPYCERKL